MKRKGDDLAISAGNLVTENQIANLKKQFDLLEGLGKDELKKKYLESLKEEKEAQIELIDIARRAKEKLEYSFKKMITGQYFFSITVTV